MKNLTRIAILGIAAVIVTGCTNEKAELRKKEREAVLAQPPLDGEALGNAFNVWLYPDKTKALVASKDPDEWFTLIAMELATSRATGCDAVFPYDPGFESFQNMTNVLKFRSELHFPVRIYCEGDTRQRHRGLPDRLPGSAAQAAKFPNYPEIGKTYLTYSDPHGFQVNYFGEDGDSWLWYPGNEQGVPEEWQIEGNDICYLHPANTYNPSTKKLGGEFDCAPLELTRRLVVGEVDGDPFSLRRGKTPYRRDKCDAPKEFDFDREAFGC